MTVTLATDRDLSYILDLSKRHAEELGFIPRAAMFAHLEAGRMTVAQENGDDVGYFLTNRVDQRHVRIFQACVQRDARGLKHGLALLSDLVTRAAQTGGHYISLRCRDGLESNGFWSACGFHVAGITPGGRARGRIIFEWRLDLATALSSPVLPYARHYLASLGQGAAGSSGPYPGQALQKTPCGAEAIGEILQKLDSRESNVARRPPTLSDNRTIAAEALRTLARAHALGS